MKKIEITNDDNFSLKDGIILTIIIIIALMFAAAAHSQKNSGSPILEATKKTSQIVITDRTWV